MPTTTNFGWTTPADTDLVKDGASAMRTLAGGIDTSMAQLKGGTTGQILSKTSNTDMAFTWINNDQGDLTAITAGTGISVTNGTGPIPTVAIDTATTVDLSTSQTLTNKTINGSSNTLTNIALSTATTGTLSETRGGTNQTTYTTGDLLYASASNTLSKRAIGTSGQVLTVSGGVPTWAAPAGGGKVLQVVYGSTTTTTTISSTTTFSDSSLSASITPSATTSKILVLVAQQATGSRNANDFGWTYKLVRGSTDILTMGSNPYYMAATAAPPNTTLMYANVYSMNYLDSPSTTSSVTYKTQGKAYLGSVTFQDSGAGGSNVSTMILLEIGA